MIRATITVNGAHFLLDGGRDIGALQDEIVAAAHAGGEFVDVSGCGDSSRSVLVTSATAVTVEITPVPLEPEFDPSIPAWQWDEFDL